MARDKLFFQSVAKVTEWTRYPRHCPQSVWTLVVALSGATYPSLIYVVSMDFIFFGLTSASLFVFRRTKGCGNRILGAAAPTHYWGLFWTGLLAGRGAAIHNIPVK